MVSYIQYIGMDSWSDEPHWYDVGDSYEAQNYDFSIGWLELTVIWLGGVRSKTGILRWLLRFQHMLPTGSGDAGFVNAF